MATIEPHKELRYGFRVRVVVKITQKDRAVLDWIRDEFQVGKVVSNRTTFDWLIKDQSLVHNLLLLISPYLQVKKYQAQQAMKIVKMEIASRDDLIKCAELADALSRFNVRSENRRKNYVVKIKEDSLP